MPNTVRRELHIVLYVEQNEFKTLLIHAYMYSKLLFIGMSRSGWCRIDKAVRVFSL